MASAQPGVWCHWILLDVTITVVLHRENTLIRTGDVASFRLPVAREALQGPVVWTRGSGGRWRTARALRGPRHGTIGLCSM